MLADALMTEVCARFGDEEASGLLPACGAGTVRALLPELEHALKFERLVRWHSGPLLERVGERLCHGPARVAGHDLGRCRRCGVAV